MQVDESDASIGSNTIVFDANKGSGQNPIVSHQRQQNLRTKDKMVRAI